MKPATKKPRLSREDWLSAGFRALAADGSGALKVEPLARDLGTTKGSFYWHFQDVPDFHAAMLTFWETHAFSDIFDKLKGETQPAARLRKLVQLAATYEDSSYGGRDCEPSIRAWSLASDQAAKAVARVDTKRLAYLSELLSECGVTNPDLARAIYAAVIGMEDLSTRDGQANDTAIGTLVDLVLALR